MNFVPFSPLNLATLTLINPDNCCFGVSPVQTVIYFGPCYFCGYYHHHDHLFQTYQGGEPGNKNLQSHFNYLHFPVIFNDQRDHKLPGYISLKCNMI